MDKEIIIPIRVTEDYCKDTKECPYVECIETITKTFYECKYFEKELKVSSNNFIYAKPWRCNECKEKFK